MPDELSKALLLEDVVAPSALAEALYVSVTGNVSLVHALTDTGAVRPEVLVRYLGRAETPFLRNVVPLPELVERLPRGLCDRLLAIPVRRDAITGTIDVVVADATDAHAPREIAFHLQAPVRVVRAPLAAIEDALRKLRPRASLRPDDEQLYDSRPRSRPADAAAPPPTARDIFPDPQALRPAPVPETFHAHTVPSVKPPSLQGRKNTPVWGTPVQAHAPSEPPRTGSDIPIPLTRRAYAAVAGGTQRPPAMTGPSGHAVDTSVRSVLAIPHPPEPKRPASSSGPPSSAFAAFAPQLPFADLGPIFTALRAAESRDEILELVVTGARTMAFKVALFIVKRAGYLGWTCTPEFGDRGPLQTVLVPHEVGSIFDRAIHEGLYLGPIRHDAIHSALLHVMRAASRDVAVVPILVSGKPAVMIVADELGDTMLATQRLEELAMAAGEALARIVRARR